MYCYVSLTIQLDISYSFAHSLNIKQSYLTHRWDPIRYYHSGSKQMAKLQDWSFTIRWFSVISRRLIGVSYPSAEMQSVYSTASADWATEDK